MITRERHCITVDNRLPVLFSKDNLDGSVRNHNETVLRGVTNAYKQTYGFRPDGGRNEERWTCASTKPSTPHKTELNVLLPAGPPDSWMSDDVVS
jgi:hypothetical protein